MARLMIIWADALLAYDGIGAEAEGRGTAFESFDRLGPLYRRIYFWRSLVISLHSARTLLNLLMKDEEFKSWLESTEGAMENFKTEKKRFDRQMKTIEKVRNQFSAHIESDIGEAVALIPEEALGSLEIGGRDAMRPHVAIHFLLAAINKGSTYEEKVSSYKEMLSNVKDGWQGMVNAMWIAVTLYQKHYPLQTP